MDESDKLLIQAGRLQAKTSPLVIATGLLQEYMALVSALQNEIKRLRDIVYAQNARNTATLKNDPPVPGPVRETSYKHSDPTDMPPSLGD